MEVLKELICWYTQQALPNMVLMVFMFLVITITTLYKLMILPGKTEKTIQMNSLLVSQSIILKG